MQAYHKKEKQKAIKKSKTEKLKQRTEKLARRNPDRIQRQIEDLKALEQSGRLSNHDRKTLQDLERDLAAVRKARETLGPQIHVNQGGGRGGRGGGEGRAGRGGMGRGAGVKRPGGEDLVNRRRLPKHELDDDSDSDSTSSSVANIPLPPGTPPPPLRQPHALPPKPVLPPSQTTYESAPILRDLRKEAAAFVPAAVKRKLEAEKAKMQEGSNDEREEGGGTEVNAGTETGIETEEVVETRGEIVGIGGIAGITELGGKVINSAPDVDDEMTRFQVEMEDEEDEEG